MGSSVVTWKFHDSVESDVESASAEWRASLCALGDWAWTSAGSDLLAVTAQQCAGPTPWLILAPLGMLAMVPWHAASHRNTGSVRYLAQDAVISSIPSARLLCDVVNRPSRRVGTALILGNPTGDLESSASEAELIHDRLYSHGKHLGTVVRLEHPHCRRARDGFGTAEELLHWLADETSPRRMLHLACHARADRSVRASPS